jgi:hypothetical protein
MGMGRGESLQLIFPGAAKAATKGRRGVSPRFIFDVQSNAAGRRVYLSSLQNAKKSRI